MSAAPGARAPRERVEGGGSVFYLKRRGRHWLLGSAQARTGGHAREEGERMLRLSF